ncbi:MAG: hypothetical protein U9Q83_00100 [Bacteroidota bacterium]|nr:hypothetical protein [Bacteroidota bacterium]
MVIQNNEITIKSGLAEARIRHLKKSIAHKEIIGLVVMQITDLIEFLGLDGKMKAKQIFDTAEFICDDFANFSLMGLQHCFNMVKKSEPPFNENLYHSINGKKIIEWLRRYDVYVDKYLFADAERKLFSDQMRAFDRKKTIGDGLIGVAGAIGTLKQNVKKRKNAK